MAPKKDGDCSSIQLPYINTFASIWEYEKAICLKQINWQTVIGDECPLCQKENCYRQIGAYRREVIDLFPFHRGWIQIARFQCMSKKLTFSLLPHQLAPYHKYTNGSMMWCLLLACKLYQEKHQGLSFVPNALPNNCADTDITPWLLYLWVQMVVRSFRKSHSLFQSNNELSDIKTKSDVYGKLTEIYSYCIILAGPGPPKVMSTRLEKVSKQIIQKTNRFFLGTPSQDR